jgi:3-oxoacyl-[acyl-carrier protein] reductase
MILEGKVALVTGASRNIGRAIALAYVREGAAVVLNARRSSDELEQVAAEVNRLGGQALPVLADVRDPAAVQKMVQQATEAFGKIDILVNNAAVRNEAPLLELSLEAWSEGLGVVLDGAFICSQAVARGMIERRYGTIVNIGGLTGQTGAVHRPQVVASKAGLIGLTKALALELAPHGITVNCVSPGMIDTAPSSSSTPDPEHRKQRVVPVGHLGAAEDIAAACLYLASPGARFVTGQTLGVNGGTHFAA